MNLPCLSISHGSGCVGHNNQGAERVNIAVGSSHNVSISVLFLSNVGLLFFISHLINNIIVNSLKSWKRQYFYLEVEVVLGIFIKHLTKGSCSDFCDLLSCSIAKSFRSSLRSRKTQAESNTRQKNELKMLELRINPSKLDIEDQMRLASESFYCFDY